MKNLVFTVSIRSPHGCKGRSILKLIARRRLGWFQSAPLTDVRGDARAAHAGYRRTGVSIRSPHGCKGR